MEGGEAEELWHIDCLVHAGAQLLVPPGPNARHLLVVGLGNAKTW